MRSTGYRLIVLILNLILLIGSVYWATENVSYKDIVQHIQSLPPKPVILSLLLNLILLSIYGFRLSVLIRIPCMQALGTVIIGFGMNGMLPFRFGEIVKLAYGKLFYNIEASRLFAATIIEKLSDLCVLFLIFMLLSNYIVVSYIDTIIPVLGMLATVSLALLMTLLNFNNNIVGLKVHKWLKKPFEIIKGQCGKAQLIKLSLYTSIIWIITVLSVFAMFGQIFTGFNWLDACALTLVLALAISIPSAPAGLGIVEAAIVAYLDKFQHAEPSKALACAFVYHAIVFVPQITFALILICKNSTSNIKVMQIFRGLKRNLK